MTKYWVAGFAAAAGLMTFAVEAMADEKLWVYTRGADTLPKGEMELELVTITRIGKNSGDYRFSDIRPEIEYGITNRLTASAELLIFNHNYSVNDPNLGPMADTQADHGGRFKDTQVAGFEAMLKYNFLSVYKDPIGFSAALGYEYRDKYRLDGADIQQGSIVVQTYFQKNFMDDKLNIAFSPKMELERRHGPGVLEEEIAFDLALGVAYRVKPNWFVGAEFRHQSDYLNPEEFGVRDPALKRSSWDLDDIRLGSQHQNGNYFGPTLHYSQKDWWVTTGVLFQIFGGGSQNAYNAHGKNWDEHERVHVGFAIGYEFGLNEND